MKKIISRISEPLSSDLQSLNLHPVLKRIYANRGIADSNQLILNVDRLIDYRNLKNIDCAISRLYDALKNKQRILIVGDYDVDGATSTALMMRFLKQCCFSHVDFLIPDRFAYGYGLTPQIVTLAKELNPDLIITVDNGIASHEGVALANEYGIDVIITDHHLASGDLPLACAIINPNQPDDHFESKNLAGVGVAFYVCLALRAKLREVNWFQEASISEPNLAEMLDLVALGTIADIVPLDQNNRILVYQGLQRIRAGYCCEAIRALAEIGNRKLKDLTSSDLGYVIGPRLNAAGRLEDMLFGVKCLLTDDVIEAKKMALQLNQLNEDRKVIENNMRLEALNALDDMQFDRQEKMPLGVCLMNETWHQGIIGILASRLKDRLQRPVIVFAPQDKMDLKGSARSITGVHLKEILEAIALEHKGLIKQFGGHAMAAGLTLNRDHFLEFSQLFDVYVRSKIDEKQCQEKIMSDGELVPSDFNLELTDLLKTSGPWGEGFSEPLFDGYFQVLDQKLVGRKHLKLFLSYQSQPIEAIAFNVDLDEWPNYGCQQVRMVYHLDLNDYGGQKRVQLLARHLEPIRR